MSSSKASKGEKMSHTWVQLLRLRVGSAGDRGCWRRFVSARRNLPNFGRLRDWYHQIWIWRNSESILSAKHSLIFLNKHRQEEKQPHKMIQHSSRTRSCCFELGITKFGGFKVLWSFGLTVPQFWGLAIVPGFVPGPPRERSLNLPSKCLKAEASWV